jgi:hypothetical protein
VWAPHGDEMREEVGDMRAGEFGGPRGQMGHATGWLAEKDRGGPADLVNWLRHNKGLWFCYYPIILAPI